MRKKSKQKRPSMHVWAAEQKHLRPSKWKGGGLQGACQVSLGREPQGSPSQCCRAQLRSCSESFDLLTWRHEMKNFVRLHSWASGGECTLPLSNHPPTPKSTHHGCVILCWWVWDHLCSLALLCFWLPLRHMQWLSPTLPAYSPSCCWVLVPS